jgi:cytochrome c oxidase cbb3-type subunit 1
LANAINWHLTNRGNCEAWKKDWALRFILAGAACYLLHGLVSTLYALPQVSAVTSLTYAGLGRTWLALHGFIAMVLFGSLYYIVPRLAQVSWPRQGWIRFHFLCAASGVALLFLSLTAGGVLQGFRLADPTVPFLAVSRGTVPFIGMSTLGVLLLLVGQVGLLANFGLLLCGLVRPICQAFCAECCGSSAEAEAKVGGQG